MPQVRVHYRGKQGPIERLQVSDDLLAVRTRQRQSLEHTPLTRKARSALAPFEALWRLEHAGVEVLRSRATAAAARAQRDGARRQLKREETVRFAGRVLADPRSGRPVLYTQNLFVKFADDSAERSCRRRIKAHGLSIKRVLDYARNAWFLAAPEDIGLEVFALAERLLGEEDVELCQPELARERSTRATVAHPRQWHLQGTTIAGQRLAAHAHVVEAWALEEGAGSVIAVIDDGVDLDHREFAAAGKVVAPRDVTLDQADARPGAGDHHGTACAGVACATGVAPSADGAFAAGVAPAARLMPIRLASGLGSQDEADAFVHAARNGADVISCSWGPRDGAWWDDSDPVHQQQVPLPDSTRLAIDWAFRNGRGGKGCVICWAAGNGNESVDNDGYASHPQVIAVAACNDQGLRSAYSDHGDAIWCSFPSNDGIPGHHGIWTTDRHGAAGYNDGHPQRGDAQGDYTASFGGTSSATPGVAGVAALVLARNPALRWDEVRDILRRCCERIDERSAGPGAYDAAGHSHWYGYGRVDARRAVDLALPPAPQEIVTVQVRRDVAIEDDQTARLAVALGAHPAPAAVRIGVDIDHTYIGDLVVTLHPPGGAAPIVLHDRQGGGTDNVKQVYDATAVPGLQALAGQDPQGEWALTVADRAAGDRGVLRSFLVELQG